MKTSTFHNDLGLFTFEKFYLYDRKKLTKIAGT